MNGAADSSRGPRWPELLGCFAGLAIVASVVFGPHFDGWGFFLDDWGDAANRYFPPGGPSFAHVMEAASNTFDYRPVLVVFTPLKYSILGPHMGLQFAWTVFLAVVIGTLLYAILRRLGVPWYHAACIAVLTIFWPWFDSTRVWESANPGPLSIATLLTGFWVALVGLDRKSWRWHTAAVVIYLIAVLTYELTLPLILFAGVVYTLRAGWRQARYRWLADIIAAVAGGIWVGTHTTRTVSGLSGDISHLGEIFEGGLTITARTFLPLGNHSRTGLMLTIVAVILAAGLTLFLWRRRSGTEAATEEASAARGWGLTQWLVLAAAGLAVAILGWAIFIPADPYYTPSVFGITNRVNAAAGYGLVILAYATIGVVVSLVTVALPRLASWVPAVTVALGLLLGLSYVHVLDQHIGIWEDSNKVQQQAISRIKKTYPTLPDGTTLFTSGFPAYYSLGVPIFAANWDENGMIRLEYENENLAAFPMLEGMTVYCGPEGVSLRGPGAPPNVASYGKVKLLDLGTGKNAAPTSRSQCETVAKSFVPGPLYLTNGAY